VGPASAAQAAGSGVAAVINDWRQIKESSYNVKHFQQRVRTADAIWELIQATRDVN
jgi:hypothetical protein